MTTLARQERPNLLQELAEGQLGLEEQVVAPLQGHELCARDASRHSATCFKGDTGVVARVHDQGRHADPCLPLPRQDIFLVVMPDDQNRFSRRVTWPISYL